MAGARKKTGPRCRTIGGVVYDLTATDRKPPCGRARPSSPSSPPKPAPKAPAVSEIIYTFEPTPTGGGYDLIASTADGTGGVAKVLATYGTRDEASAAAREAKKTGVAPAPKKREPGAWERGKAARRVVVNDHRVRERLEREREHREREARNDAARAQFSAKAPERTTLADAGRLPKRPPLKASDRDLLRKVDKANRAGLLYHAGHHAPSVHRQFVDLVERGELKDGGPYLFLLPSYEGKGLRSMGKPKPASDAKPKLPRSLEESRQLLRVGDLVSYATPGTSIGTLGTVELEYGIVTEAPNYSAAREVDQRPTVKFVDPQKLDGSLRALLPPDAYASQPGFSRHLPLSKLYYGWLAPQRGWHKPKGFL